MAPRTLATLGAHGWGRRVLALAKAPHGSQDPRGAGLGATWLERWRTRQLLPRGQELPTGPSTACPSTGQVNVGVNIQNRSRDALE